MWMECDGLKEPICSFTGNHPNFCLTQVHLVLWERLPKCANFQPAPTALKLMEQSQHISKIHFDEEKKVKFEPPVLTVYSSPDTPFMETSTNSSSEKSTILSGDQVVNKYTASQSNKVNYSVGKKNNGMEKNGSVSGSLSKIHENVVLNSVQKCQNDTINSNMGLNENWNSRSASSDNSNVDYNCDAEVKSCTQEKSKLYDKNLDPNKSKVSGVTLGGTERNIFVGGMMPLNLSTGNDHLKCLEDNKSESILKNYSSDRTSKKLADINKYIASTNKFISGTDKIQHGTISNLSNNKTPHSFTAAEKVPDKRVSKGFPNNSLTSLGNDRTCTIDEKRPPVTDNVGNIISHLNGGCTHKQNINKFQTICKVAPVSSEVKSNRSSDANLQKLKEKLNDLRQGNALKQAGASTLHNPQVSGYGQVNSFKNGQIIKKSNKAFIEKSHLINSRDTAVAIKPVTKSVLNILKSPSQQRSTVQELLAKVRGKNKVINAQTFDGYRSKSLAKTTPLEVKVPDAQQEQTGVSSKYAKLLSPSKKGSQKSTGRKIRFGESSDSPSKKRKGKICAPARKRVNLTEQFVCNVDEPLAKCLKSDKNCTDNDMNKDKRNNACNMVYNVGTVFEGYTVENGVKRAIVNGKSANKPIQSSILHSKPSVIKKSNGYNQITTSVHSQDVNIGKLCHKKDIYNGTDQTVKVQNLVSGNQPYSFNGNPIAQQTAVIIDNHVNSNLNGKVTEPPTSVHGKALENSNVYSTTGDDHPVMNHNGDSLTAVLNELCATLDIPSVSTVSSTSEPVHSILDANISSDLNKSGEYGHIDFDSFLFGGSPVKTGAFT